MAMAYVKDAGIILIAHEGDGSNLLPEDIEAGYVDYIYYTTYEADSWGIEEADGGMLLLTVPFKERFKTDEDVIEETLSDIGYSGYSYLMLKEE